MSLIFPNGSSYQIGFGINGLGNSIYSHAGDYANAVYSDAQKIWDREDSAYQRMVADMKKAGLNPWAAIGSGGSPTSATNPSMEGLTGLLSVLSGSLESEKTYTQSSKRLFDEVIDALTMFVPFVK